MRTAVFLLFSGSCALAAAVTDDFMKNVFMMLALTWFGVAILYSRDA